MSGMPADPKALIGMPISGPGISGKTTIMDARYDRSDYGRLTDCVFITLTDNIPEDTYVNNAPYTFGVPMAGGKRKMSRKMNKRRKSRKNKGK